jgi:hypothetical protein
MDARPSLTALLIHDGPLRWGLFTTPIVAAGVGMLVWTLFVVWQLEPFLGRIALAVPIALIGGFVILAVLRLGLKGLRARVRVLRRLAERGVVVRAEIANEGWTAGSEGSYWTATYRYSFMERIHSLERRGLWAGMRSGHPRALVLLIDPEAPSDEYVLRAAEPMNALAELPDRLGSLAFLVFAIAWLVVPIAGWDWASLAAALTFLGLPAIWLVSLIASRLARGPGHDQSARHDG